MNGDDALVPTPVTVPDGSFLVLEADEMAYVLGIDQGEDAKVGRCSGCGHLNALHSDHCCRFCMVGDCECDRGGEGWAQ